ncbi:MAG: chemotaxis protein CheW [Chlamydiota bacterium]|nr:chemotaxis protein CheW [Chlamydiota bacterium]
MLYLKFYVANHRFIVNVFSVYQVIPWIYPIEVFNNQNGVYGLLKFRGEVLPLIDLSLLLQKRFSKDRMNTRIIILERACETGQCAKMGVIAERVTDTVSIDSEQFQENLIYENVNKYITKFINDDAGIMRVIDADALFELCDFDAVNEEK